MSLAVLTILTAFPSLLVGGFLVAAVTFFELRGDEDSWGVAPFALGVGLALFALAAVAMASATLGQRAEGRTATRSPWSILGLGVAIVAAVPAGLILKLLS